MFLLCEKLFYLSEFLMFGSFDPYGFGARHLLGELIQAGVHKLR
jgi:hypothetical protein